MNKIKLLMAGIAMVGFAATGCSSKVVSSNGTSRIDPNMAPAQSAAAQSTNVPAGTGTSRFDVNSYPTTSGAKAADAGNIK